VVHWAVVRQPHDGAPQPITARTQEAVLAARVECASVQMTLACSSGACVSATKRASNFSRVSSHTRSLGSIRRRAVASWYCPARSICRAIVPAVHSSGELLARNSQVLSRASCMLEHPHLANSQTTLVWHATLGTYLAHFAISTSVQPAVQRYVGVWHPPCAGGAVRTRTQCVFTSCWQCGQGSGHSADGGTCHLLTRRSHSDGNIQPDVTASMCHCTQDRCDHVGEKLRPHAGA
jgi:hypothetical protein